MSAAKRKAKSPAWRNPRDMIKRHLKRKSNRCLVSEALASSSSAPNLGGTCEPLLNINNSIIRSNNPFKHSSPVKRIRSGTEKENNEILNFETENALLEFPSGIFDFIRENEKEFDGRRNSRRLQAISSLPPVDFSSLTSSTSFSRDSNTSRGDVPDRKVLKTLPVDLRLGTKIRIESLKPFPWMGNENTPDNYQVRITGLESDTGIQLFLRSSSESKQEKNCFATAEVSPMARLEASTLYWQFPNIPWMTTFPRLDAARKFIGLKKEKVPSLCSLGKVFVESLTAQWVAAFSHLFFSWKKGARPNFYLCCPAFTVLFIKSTKDKNCEIDESSCSRLSWASNSALSVIITPTTSGFRQLLREEGINFDLPLRQTSRRSSREHADYFGLGGENSVLNEATQSSLLSATDQSHSRLISTMSSESLKSPKADSEEAHPESDAEQDISGDSDNATWLQEIGVSPKLKKRLTKNLSFSSVNERSLMDSAMAEMTQHSMTHLSSPSDVSKTVVLITEPSSIQALFNFLNESKACHPTTGPSAGLPPTLLSSEPFLHSTLKSLTKFSQIVKSDTGETKYICELDNGPIMPHMLSQLKTFFATCPSLNVPENRVKVHIYGRNFCAALNQASNYEGASSYTFFEYAVNENLYYIA